MRTTGEFHTVRYEIEFEKYDEPIYLLPFGDVHKSSPMHHSERWKEFLEWAHTKKRAFFLGMGDYDDLASTSERRLLLDPDLHESTVQTLEELYLNNCKRFARDVEFMKGRLIGLLGGNHYGQFQNGTTTDQKLCELLSCRWLGVNAFIRLSFHNRKRGTKTRTSVDIWAHHGRGGATTVGGSMNPVERMAHTAEADIYLMGDNHQKGAVTKSRLKLRDGRGGLNLSQRKVILARTGSFLKGYEQGCKSYIVDGAMTPTDLGVVKIELTPRRTREGGVESEYVDIHASI